ncbi:MAG: hypothetical protein WCY15_07360 [Phenylobacterium sp.]|jgi:hypothetical protein|uniref:alpha/beta fold hydrolase n=1 Tax=Phenylobacterium sp. TaxID=1871053 RepID=UPI002A28D17E|nr:hypothetical protein [Phenylobacterium sp.]MDD3837539.1 hypothetical protein [Phenylobacterium sp.]MDX9996410.1 hypothetical protein [Phenylobacterium sp.]
MTDLQLRPATFADVPAIADLVRRAYAPWGPILGREPKPMGGVVALLVALRNPGRVRRLVLAGAGHDLAAARADEVAPLVRNHLA